MSQKEVKQMDNSIIHIDDWNTLFNKTPPQINDRTCDILNGFNNCIDRANYSILKSYLATLMNDIGEFEYVSHATGDQAIVHAVVLAKKYFNVKHIYVAKEAFHGITMKYLREEIFNLEDLSIIEFGLDSSKEELKNSITNALLILEPFLFFAKYGDAGIEMIRTIVAETKKNGTIVLFDEIRSGVFSSGPFLFSQKCMPISVDFICFSKGLALGVPTSVLSIKKNIISNDLLKKEDIFKSCMAISEVAMYRSNALLEYYLNDIKTFNSKMSTVTEKIIKHFRSFERFKIVKQINITGLTCIIVFKESTKKATIKLLWLYMLSKKIEVRPVEKDLWFFNFALDATDEELLIVKDSLEEAFKLTEPPNSL